MCKTLDPVRAVLGGFMAAISKKAGSGSETHPFPVAIQSLTTFITANMQAQRSFTFFLFPVAISLD